MKILEGIRRLYLIAICTHKNACVDLAFEDSTEVRICQACGRIMHVMDDGDRRHNKHKEHGSC